MVQESRQRGSLTHFEAIAGRPIGWPVVGGRQVPDADRVLIPPVSCDVPEQ